MHIKNIKQSIMALAVCVMSGATLVACDTGTKPGDTNTEHSDIKDTEEMSGANNATTNGDTVDLEEKYYEGRDTTVLGEGAYDGKGEGKDRDDY